MSTKLRAVFLFFLILTFGVLVLGGYLINKSKPPIPDMVTTSNGDAVFTRKDIVDGQNYYFSRGGQQTRSRGRLFKAIC